jgi:hypothetical protein
MISKAYLPYASAPRSSANRPPSKPRFRFDAGAAEA